LKPVIAVAVPHRPHEAAPISHEAKGAAIFFGRQPSIPDPKKQPQKMISDIKS
jgi:hypothetical protein